MTRRVKLLQTVIKYNQCELVVHGAEMSLAQIDKRLNSLYALYKRLPHITQQKPKISSQRKLFY